MQRIQKFYDQYASRQERVGINLRHRIIFSLLKSRGLRKDSRVLEIGCGIGTLTHLIGRYCNLGSILATDISPKSIEKARKLNKDAEDIEFMITDMADFSRPERFDVVVLADVLEHIPPGDHEELFHVICDHIHERSFVFIHIPNPFYLEYLKKNRPDLLQLIDEPVHADKVIPHIYASGLYLHELQMHSVFSEQEDYQFMVLKPQQAIQEMHKKKKWKLVLKELWHRVN